MFLFDTDHLSILQSRNQPACSRILTRMGQHAPQVFFASIVSLHEQIMGASGMINGARNAKARLYGYVLLRQTIHHYNNYGLVDFDQKASDTFDALRSQRIRIGTMDLRIASIALANGCTVLTRNTRDFRLVPGLVIEDWTI